MDASGRVAELEVENAALRARVGELNEQVASLTGKLADLEKLLGRDSSNSSKPPSTDPGAAKTSRPENANRAARRAMGRKQGKQPGAPGHTLAQVPDPDRVVNHRPDRRVGVIPRPLHVSTCPPVAYRPIALLSVAAISAAAAGPTPRRP